MTPFRVFRLSKWLWHSYKVPSNTVLILGLGSPPSGNDGLGGNWKLQQTSRLMVLGLGLGDEGLGCGELDIRDHLLGKSKPAPNWLGFRFSISVTLLYIIATTSNQHSPHP